MVIIISQFRLMLPANIHHRHTRIIEIVLGRLPTHDCRFMHRDEQTARKKLVFVRATWMGKDF